MAELLTVIAILAILMALVGVGVYNYLRDLKLPNTTTRRSPST